MLMGSSSASLSSWQLVMGFCFVLKAAVIVFDAGMLQPQLTSIVLHYGAGDLHQKLEQLKIRVVSDTIDVAWDLKKPGGPVITSIPTPRYALWMPSNNTLLITVPKAHRHLDKYNRHVQDVAAEMARCD